jgi:hypothetical protein
MDLLIKEPNITTPAILRAEIMADLHCNGERIIVRKVVPREGKEPFFQRILQETLPNRLSVEHTIISYKSDFKNEVNYIKNLPIASLDSYPYFYPKLVKFRYVYEKNLVAIEVVPITNKEQEPKELQIWSRLLKFVIKISNGFMNGYQKRVHHDLLVPKSNYQDFYGELKAKYMHWVDKWCEDTDPLKHVFEDIAIAAWLILLWSQSPTTLRKYKFVDLGCGNGLLVHILQNEGYFGYGIDLSRRKLWDLFPKSTDLRERLIQPNQEVFQDVEWIIGNHPDELTLWIPLISAKSGPESKFMILPCCFYDKSGCRSINFDPKIGRYSSYCNKIEEESTKLGFVIERETLRIPSTKNICLISRRRNFEANEDLISRQGSIAQIKLRRSDREKTLAYLTKKSSKLGNNIETKIHLI